jgi:hypothetical protein
MKPRTIDGVSFNRTHPSLPKKRGFNPLIPILKEVAKNVTFAELWKTRQGGGGACS